MRADGPQEDRHGAFRATLGTQGRGRDEGAIAHFGGEDQEEGLRHVKSPLKACLYDVEYDIIL